MCIKSLSYLFSVSIFFIENGFKIGVFLISTGSNVRQGDDLSTNSQTYTWPNHLNNEKIIRGLASNKFKSKASVGKSDTVSYYASTYFTLLLNLAATATITPQIRKIESVIGIPTLIISGKTSGRPAVRKGG